ncbi:chitin binding Peritrophin-A domain protein [Cooperia oncophora]
MEISEVPISLLFNMAKGYCDYPEDCFSDNAMNAQSHQSAPSQAQQQHPSTDQTKSVSSSFCAMRKDGFYAEKCSVDFISCEQGVATPMRCPSGLLFNEKEGYCDYPENCSTGPAPPASISVPDVPAQSSFASDDAVPVLPSPIDCKGKKDGYYSNGCSAEFVYCLDGVASPMTCPTSLVFNEKKGFCDYVENCSAEPAVVPAPALAPAAPVGSSPAAAYAPPVQSSSIDCKERKDGYYSNGCVADFVYCVDGVASPMTCPTSLVFNEKKGYCDYVENCSVGPAVVAPATATTGPIPVPAGPATFSQAVSFRNSVHSAYVFDFMWSLCSSPQVVAHFRLIDCKGRKDGYYSNGCVPDFVYCVDGVASPMTCPTSLVFNEKSGYCDYVENCSAGPVPVVPALAPATPVMSSPAAAYAPPVRSSSIDCKGRKDGYYSNGCVPDFVYCADGVASPMTCPTSLVFNEMKGYCDYVENCSVRPAEAVPAPAPAAPIPAPAASATSSHVAFPPPVQSSSVDCKGRKDGYYSNGCVANFVYCVDGVASSMGRKDGYYSNGCVPDFVYCVDGVASPMTCPTSLVFNEKKGYCDYVEKCSAGPASVGTAPAPAAPISVPPAALTSSHAVAFATAVQSSYVFETFWCSFSSSQVIPRFRSIDCKGRKDGFYSNGCVSDFVYCLDGVASPMTCPTSLVFNEKKGYCDYIESCSAGPVPIIAAPIPMPAASASSSHVAAVAPVVQSSSIDCKGRKDGYYSNGCVASFVSCVDGVASPMTCPTSLVFNQKKGYCDYVENCSSRDAPVVPAPAPAAPVMPSPAVAYASLIQSSPIDCKGRKDGYYSKGCVATFVSCVDGVASPMTCPTSLVFNEKKGYCDYVENCSVGPAPAVPAPAPAVPIAAAAAPATSAHAAVITPLVQSSSIDCKGRKDGYYSNGCVANFVYCVNGVASPMTCPTSLVFNEKKGYCDYVENCSARSAPVVTAPAPAAPISVPARPATSSQAVVFSPPVQSSYVFATIAFPSYFQLFPLFRSIDCKGKKDGYYSNGCVSNFVTAWMESIDCKGRKDGYYSNGCVANFVYCVNGVASSMTCPTSLVFNEKKGYCDYVENCSAGTAPAAGPIPVPAGPATSSSAPAFTPPTCPTSLVFNEKKGICDYVENCSAGPAPVVPAPLPAAPVPVPPGPASSSPAAAYAPPIQSSSIDCKGRKDGYYSNGCVANFVYCVDGVASPMTCPTSLVFNEKKGYCDYVESCSTGPSPVVPAPVPAAPIPVPAAAAKTVFSPPVQELSIDCKGRKDGYYSNGCVPDFVYCVDGVATAMTCPVSLVFNERKGYCDYVESCSAGPVPAPAIVKVTPSQPGPALVPSSQMAFDCTGRGDGYFSNGCSSDFVHCSEGIATFMKCPASLVFNVERGYCDYPENCAGREVEVQKSSVTSAAQVTSFVCPKPNGAFSRGCSSEFYICSNGVAQVMQCPGDLVYNEAEGYCDLKESCFKSEKAKSETMHKPISSTTASVPASSATLLISLEGVAAASECSNLPDGRYGSPCGTKFTTCSSGVAYFMNCPADLVFDSKQSRCVYSHECGLEPVLKSSADAAPTSYTSLISRNDCAGKSDGLHSLGCIAEFIQCVDGNAYSLYCPAGLVFVEELGVCDVPSSCSQAPKREPADGPMSYEPVADEKGKNSSVRQLRGRRKFVGKCPAGLVFNMEKVYCDYPENCRRGEESASTEARPVPSTVIDKDESCKGRPDGVITDSDCQPKFTTCMSDVAFVTKCPAGLVYSVTAKMCDYPEACGMVSGSSVTSTVSGSSVTSYVKESNAAVSSTVQKTVTSSKSSSRPTSASVQYQHSTVGKDLCAGKSDGPLNTTDCRPSFSFCVNGALYSTTCPEGLLYSFTSRRCEWASECGNVAPQSEPSKHLAPSPVQGEQAKATYTTASTVQSASDSTRVQSPASPARPASDSARVTIVDDFDCSTRANGKYSLGGCVGRFVMCSDGRAYVRGCPNGLVYNEAKGLCDYDCSGVGVGSSTMDVTKAVSSSAQSSAIHIRPPPSSGAAREEPECVTSVALGRCSSKFWRCKNGRLESAQCPGQSLFDETFSLCVYDLPECRTQPASGSTSSDEVATTTETAVVSTEAVHTSSEVYSAPTGNYPAPAAPAQQYTAQTPSYVYAMNNPFGMFYPSASPMGFRDAMHGRDKVNHGLINFQSRSVLAGGSRPHVRDVFDGIVNPWLLPGIDQVFLPFLHKRLKDRRDHSDELYEPKGVDVPQVVDHNKVEESTSTEPPHDDMPLENAHTTDEHDHDQKTLPESELGNSTVEEATSQSPVDTTTPVTETSSPDIEGSGSGDSEVTRKRRSYTNSANFSTTCTSSQSPGLISIGFCRQDFIFCKAVADGVMAACPVGDLFDTNTSKCVASATCGLPEQVVPPPPPPAQESIAVFVPTTTPAPLRHTPAPPPKPVKVPSVPVHAVPIATTTKRPLVIYPPMPAPKPAPEIVHQSRQSGCLEGSDYAVDCNGNFMKCVHGIAYPMKCPAGLVFDQTKQLCDYPAAVVGCSEVQLDHTRPDHSQNHPTDKTYPGEPISLPTTQAPAQEAPDFCAYLSDGPHSEGCTASFVVCHDRRVQASMNCPLGTWFDHTRGICDFREKVAACGGSLDEPAAYQPQPVVVRTTTPSSHDDSCPQDPQPVGRCMSKFLICSNGIQNEFDCAKPLVFNPATVSCDFREFVPECEQFKGEDATPKGYDAAEPTVAPTATSTAAVTTTAPPSCVYDNERPAFALDYCSRVYGMCTEHGVLKREECKVGLLFDSHLSTCVPAERCGQEHLKDILSKVTFAPPQAAAQVAKDTSKYVTRKDDRCRNSLEGAMKPMGRCRSSYIRCMGGEAIVEPCATTAEVFSAAVGACVLRINAPECHTAPQRSPQPYTSTSSNDPSMFCRTRTDGLYRNPTDCAAILQCFGGDVFEYPSCSSGLVFNELTSKCDYRDAVPECRQAADESTVERGCHGAKHGDFVANESDCQQFYRCVWDRLEPMRCPSGTVFNPKLSVCDWPDNVPQCTAQQDESKPKKSY